MTSGVEGGWTVPESPLQPYRGAHRAAGALVCPYWLTSTRVSGGAVQAAFSTALNRRRHREAARRRAARKQQGRGTARVDCLRHAAPQTRLRLAPSLQSNLMPLGTPDSPALESSPQRAPLLHALSHPQPTSAVTSYAPGPRGPITRAVQRPYTNRSAGWSKNPGAAVLGGPLTRPRVWPRPRTALPKLQLPLSFSDSCSSSNPPSLFWLWPRHWYRLACSGLYSNVTSQRGLRSSLPPSASSLPRSFVLLPVAYATSQHTAALRNFCLSRQNPHRESQGLVCPVIR